MSKMWSIEYISKKLEDVAWHNSIKPNWKAVAEYCVDYHTEDIMHILSPLIKYKRRSKDKGWGLGETDKLIDTVLKNAGVENDLS